MAKLAAWTTDRRRQGRALQSPLRKVRRSQIELEKELEDWIADDVSLIGEGLTLVGRQVTIYDGRLDLLAIDDQDRWVVIEIKPGMLSREALTQALNYASSLASLDGEELKRLLEPDLGNFGDPSQLSERLNQQLAAEEGDRQIAMLLVGAGVRPGLERLNEFLKRFVVPVDVVSFEVFELDDGFQLLIREVVNEPVKPSSLPRHFTLDAVFEQAANAGVGTQFERFVKIARAAGLVVRPNQSSVTVAPSSDRRRMLIFAYPTVKGQIYFEVGLSNFAEFFPRLDEMKTDGALRRLHKKSFASGEELDAILDGVEQFLTEEFSIQSSDGE